MHSLVLPGCEQSNGRAEVCAVLPALQLTLRCTVYSDCQYVVDAARVRMECLQTKRTPPAMTHIDLWEKFDTLLVDRSPGCVEFIKVMDRCRHHNNLADSAAKAAVKNADFVSFNQIRALCATQDELRHVVGQFHRFIARCAEHEFTKNANVAVTTRFDISVLDVASGCFSHIALIDDDALAKCPYGLVFARALVA